MNYHVIMKNNDEGRHADAELPSASYWTVFLNPARLTV